MRYATEALKSALEHVEQRPPEHKLPVTRRMWRDRLPVPRRHAAAEWTISFNTLVQSRGRQQNKGMPTKAEVEGMPRSRASFKHALVLAGACLPLTWLALSPELAHGEEVVKAEAAKPFEDLTQ